MKNLRFFAEPVLSGARFFGRLRSPEGRLRQHRPQNDRERRAHNDIKGIIPGARPELSVCHRSYGEPDFFVEALHQLTTWLPLVVYFVSVSKSHHHGTSPRPASKLSLVW